jgi:hypothetical protein
MWETPRLWGLLKAAIPCGYLNRAKFNQLGNGQSHGRQPVVCIYECKCKGKWKGQE